jgi:hypothetical protein
MLVAGLGNLAIFPANLAKKPLVKAWQNVAERIEPPEDWVRVGVPTGPVNGIDVIDVDPEGLDWFRQNFNALPRTRIHKTPRGWHVLFKCSPGLKCSTSQISKGVDAKSSGGQIIWWPRQGYPVEDNPLCEMPGWLLAMMPVKTSRDRALSPSMHVGWLSDLDPIDYRDHDDWFALMVRAHNEGIAKEAFIAWSTSDERYANSADVISRRWDSLRIGDWGRRVDARLAELDNARSYHGAMDGKECPVPQYLHQPQYWQPTNNLQHRIDSLLAKVTTEPLLFWASGVMRELIFKNEIKPAHAIQLLESSWPIINGAKAPPLPSRQAVRRVIASAFLVVEDKMENV